MRCRQDCCSKGEEGALREVTGGTLLFTLLGSWGRCLRGRGCTAWTHATLSGGTPRAAQGQTSGTVTSLCLVAVHSWAQGTPAPGRRVD